ncbi:8-amino-7-oxononanoate synthase [Vibrio sinaloensis]|uniref:8-amino-7-oxononanoate synthase n=1 Tax=Photobacterium sp. (strain ATCC 43367) TaxID=379097 RepID=UPI0035EFC528
MPVFKRRIDHALSQRQTQGLTRKLNCLANANHVQFHVEEQSFINFSSNDYLGLASDKSLGKAWQHGIDLYGNGSAASPLVTGFSVAHQELESALCEWLGFERAILFSSGFSANQALLFSLLEKGDLLLQDKLNHASLMEAGMLSPATMKRFKHNDIRSLQMMLKENALVVTEGVFSMDGDLSPLRDIQATCQSKAWLMVDDAHGIGVLGSEGRGSCQHAGIKPDILVVTFGKAFGLSGAAILCDSQVGDYLTQFARHHVYSTAIPPSQAHALTQAVGMLRTEQWRRDKLAELQNAYRAACGPLPGYVETQTPIKPFIIGDSAKSLDVAKQLKRQGHWVTAIRPPTVAKNTARLRFTLTTNHTVDDVKALGQSLTRLLEGME